MPVLLVHGWPDSPLRFVRLIPLLTAAGHDVVVPTIPGFGFSDQPTGEMSPALVADDLAWLMGQLGYSRYAAHGGDWGSAIATALTESHPEAVVALHLTDVPWDKTFSVGREQASPPEQAFLDAAVAWAAVQTYLTANTRNPDTVAMALSDSPVGLLAWIAEMYQEWSEDPIPDDDVLAQVSLIWFTNTLRSSIRLYSEPAQSWDDAGDGDWGDAADWGGGTARGADGVRAVPPGPGRGAAPGVRRALLRRRAVHRDAEGRPLRRPGAAGAAGRGPDRFPRGPPLTSRSSVRQVSVGSSRSGLRR